MCTEELFEHFFERKEIWFLDIARQYFGVSERKFHQSFLKSFRAITFSAFAEKSQTDFLKLRCT